MKPVVVCVFAAEFGPNGDLSDESRERCWTTISLLQKIEQTDFIILLAAGSDPDKQTEQTNGQLMKDYLADCGTPERKIFCCGMATNTQDEIRAMSAFIKGQGLDQSQIYGVSSWYHLPRIFLMWQRFGAGKIKLKAAWLFSFYILKRAALEPLKTVLTFINLKPELRRALSGWFRKRGLI